MIETKSVWWKRELTQGTLKQRVISVIHNSNENHALHIYLTNEWTIMLKPESASLAYKHYNITGLHVEGIKLP